MKKTLALVSLFAITTQVFAQGPFTSLIFGAGARSGAGLLGRGLFAEAAAAEVAAAEGIAARGAMRSFSGMGRGLLAAEEGVIAAESRAFAPMSRGFFRSGGSRFGSAALATEEGAIAAESRLATRGAMRGMGRGLLAAEEGAIAAETRVLAHPMSRAGGSLFRRGGGGGGLLSAEAEAAVAAETRIASHPMARVRSGGVLAGEAESTAFLPPANRYPPRGGFFGQTRTTHLEPGMEVDRFGSIGGRYLSPQGTSFPRRALPPDAASSGYSVFRVAKPLEVESGIAGPWFGQSGGGIQYRTLVPIETLVKKGFLVPVR